MYSRRLKLTRCRHDPKWKKESDPVDHTQLATNTAPLFLSFFFWILYKGLKNRKQLLRWAADRKEIRRRYPLLLYIYLQYIYFIFFFFLFLINISLTPHLHEKKKINPPVEKLWRDRIKWSVYVVYYYIQKYRCRRHYSLLPSMRHTEKGKKNLSNRQQPPFPQQCLIDASLHLRITSNQKTTSII